MKKLLVGLFMLFASPALAGVSCSVPFNLTNGTTADASQVMANYNAILACLATGTAASGVNNDITALNALTTPLTPAQGGNFLVFSGTSVSGTVAGATAVGTTLPSSFALSNVGVAVTYVSDGANPAGPLTLNVRGTGTFNFYRPTPSGPVPMVGGEIVTGQIVTATWDGAEYQMTSQPALGYAPGAVFDYAGSACPAGSLETTGSSTVSTATYPTLFANIGTLWGTTIGGDFTIPDLRGRGTFSRDSSGSGRITAAGGNFDGTAVGNVGGQQSNVLNKVNFASGVTFAVSGATNLTANISNSGSITGGTSGIQLNAVSTTGFDLSTGSNLVIATQGTAASGGTSTPLPTLSNAGIVIKCIKG
jgi:hypothetical protein